MRPQRKALLFSAIFLLSVISLGREARAQAQATSANQINENGVQCSSVGVGYGKNPQDAQMNADANRDRAGMKARKRGNFSFSNKTGGGASICRRYKENT